MRAQTAISLQKYGRCWDGSLPTPPPSKFSFKKSNRMTMQINIDRLVGLLLMALSTAITVIGFVAVVF